RDVKIPRELLKFIPSSHVSRLLTEEEWRSIGIIMSPGWEHYIIHAPEPVIAYFQ
ncbi:cyclin-dependent kinases regulatory subunit, partial [Cladochytrium replicatum]